MQNITASKQVKGVKPVRSTLADSPQTTTESLLAENRRLRKNENRRLRKKLVELRAVAQAARLIFSEMATRISPCAFNEFSEQAKKQLDRSLRALDARAALAQPEVKR